MRRPSPPEIPPGEVPTEGRGKIRLVRKKEARSCRGEETSIEENWGRGRYGGEVEEG